MSLTAIIITVGISLQIYGPAAQMLREDPDRGGVYYKWEDISRLRP